jgi:hypothetical protein
LCELSRERGRRHLCPQGAAGSTGFRANDLAPIGTRGAGERG